MTFFQDLGIAEAVFQDIALFASGQPVAVPIKSVGTYNVQASVVSLPTGPTAQFPVIASLMGVMSLGFEAASGTPVSFAEKIGNAWLGYTIAVTKAA